MAAENTNKNLQIKIKPRKAQWGCPRPALLHLQGRARGDGSAKVRRMVMVSCFHDKDVHGVMFFIMVMTRNFLLDNNNDGICCQICPLY